MDLSLKWAPVASPVVEAPCRVEFQLAGIRRELDVADVAVVRFERADPVRKFPAWRGRKHYDGAYWLASVGHSVPFESLTERSCLLELDRRGDVALVASQPMWIRWGEPGRSEHVPDFFARTVDGDALLIDVKPAQFLDDEAVRAQFDRTAVLAEDLGWTYLVYPGASMVRDANLRFLMRYRGQGWRDHLGQFDSAGVEGSIAEVAERMGGGERGLARCYYLLWNGRLSVDLERPLSLRSMIRGTKR